MPSPQTLSLTPTEEQIAVIEAMSGSDSVMVNAYAGCAKTTTLELASQKIRQPALALAFNKSITKELEKRFPSSFSIKSFNALGHGAWARRLPGGSITLDERKLGKLVTAIAKDWKLNLVEDQWAETLALARTAMMRGLSPCDEGSPMVPDLPEVWEGFADDLFIGRDSSPRLIELARATLIRSIAEAKEGKISFDDQVYCPTILGGSWTRFPVLFVDEAQDLSPLNHRMLGLSARPDAKLVVCGDAKQAIYAFRGADSASMGAIEALRGSWLHRPLATTFRCPKVIVTRQQRHAPGFRAAEGNPEGAFLRLPKIQTKAFASDEPMALEPWSYKEVRDLVPAGGKLAILCRNNGPLLSLAFSLLRRNISVHVLGRDIGKGLITLSKKLAPEDGTKVEEFLDALAQWEQDESALARLNGNEGKLSAIADKAECLRCVASGTKSRDMGQLRTLLAQLFAREAGQVTLSSIHRSKGLEWDVVVHLDPWRCPSKRARRAAEAGDMGPIQQEWNLRYVCETRAKATLIEANLDGFEG
jgi:hypothetical protein